MPSPQGGAPESVEQARHAAGATFKAVLDELARRYPERDCALQQAALALVAREHLLIFGPPGTGKSELAAVLLRRFVDHAGRPSLYARQIVETTVQTDLVGPVDFKTLTETGRTVYHLDEGLLAAEHAVLDEVFDGRDLLLRSILSVLNERELALGPVVHKARLSTAVLTTNRYLSEILNARPETLLAFTDRIAFACFVPKSFASPASRQTVLRLAAEPPTEPLGSMSLEELHRLQQACREVRVPEDVRAHLAALVDVFAKMLQEATVERKGYAPTCFLSPRTLAKSVGVLRAGVVLDRYVEGRDRPLQVSVADLARLRSMFALGGPPADDLGRVVTATTDPKEKWQLENVRLEAAAFERALAIVATDSERAAEAEAKALALPEMRARARRLSAANAAELALLVFQARRNAVSESLRTELDGLALSAALAFAEGARAGTLPPLPSGERTVRLRACLEIARALAARPEHAALAASVARQGAVECVAEVHGLGASESGAEFDVRSTATLGDLAERATGLDRRLTSAVELGGELEAMTGVHPPRPLATIVQDARRRVARTLRRRAMLLMGGASRDQAGWKALADLGRRVEELDEVLDRLCPGEGKVRSYALSSRAGLLLAGELQGMLGMRLADFAAALCNGVERLKGMSVEPWRALRVCRPVLERRLELALASLASLPASTEVPSEDGYARLLKSCGAGKDRMALHALATAAGASEHPLVQRLDTRLGELDVHELALQVNYLARWLDDVMASVPEPGELASHEEAEAVWAHVAGTRFFAVGWRDRDLSELERRLAQLSALPACAEEAGRVLASLAAVADTADRFGRALLERRAELAAA